MFSFGLVLHSLMQSRHMEVIVLFTFFEVDASLGSMCHIHVSYFEMGNVVYVLFVVEALFL